MNANLSVLPIRYLNPDDEKVGCQRCKTETSILISRKEHFCKRCFIRFIRGKQRKQMQDDRLKVKYGEVAEKLGAQKVLLPSSFGVSSLVLTDAVASLLQEQVESHKGKQAFELIILNIDEFELKSLEKGSREVISKLLKNYENVDIRFKSLNLSSYILDQEMLQKISITKQFAAFHESISIATKNYTLNDILDLCPNKSSVEDLLGVIYDELVIRTAYLEGCETIVYGHSMTRIANEVIALTVKGRGSTIYKAISDHTATFRSKEFLIKFPLRDVLLAEIVAYSELLDLDQYQIKSNKATSKITKNMTIRGITTQYFNHLDNNGYASTASTVVKTGDKLGAPKFDEVSSMCQICGVEIHQDPKEWLRRITVSEAMPLENEEEFTYAEQYKSHYGDFDNQDFSEMNHLNVCYGCIVTLGGIKPDTGFVWPIKNPEDEEREILNEYILTDDEDDEE